MRFYGGSLSEWAALPVGIAFQLLELSHRLRAEERLMYVVDAQASSGYAKKGEVMRHVRNLQQMASGTRERRGDGLADVAAMGIKVVQVKVGSDG